MPGLTMETQSSQDVHHSPVLNAILAPIRDLNENWKVDLSTHLEMYLRELCDQQCLGSVNFVEAALLIQRSAGIYVKKVEYLWNLLMQVLDSFRKKGMPGEKGHDKRKKSGNVSELFQDFIDITVNPDKKKWKGKQYPVKLDPPYYSELEHNCPREKKLSLFDHMFEPLGDKSDFRLNYPISGSFLLEEELSYINFPENNDDAAVPECDASCNMSPDNDDIACVPNLCDDPMDVDDDISPEPIDVDPNPILLEKVGHSIHPADCGDVIATVDALVNSSINVWDTEAGSIPDKTVKVQDRCKMPCDTLEKNKKKGALDSSVSSLVTDNIRVSFGNRYEEFPKFRLEFVEESKKKRKMAKQLQKAEEVEEYRKVLATDFPVDFLGFEDTEISSGEEDGFAGYPDDLDRDDPLLADPEAANADPEGSATVPFGEDVPLPNVVNINDDEWGQVYQNILQEKMHSARVDNQDAQAALATRVNQWHESIHTKLKGAEERGSMDIHEYGTHILNTFPKANGKYLKTTIDFAEVVKDQEREEVCRYFLACLMLANTYNIEISVSDPRELAMNCMELTLLKSKRHHESLEEYEAPSQSQAKTQKRNKK